MTRKLKIIYFFRRLKRWTVTHKARSLCSQSFVRTQACCSPVRAASVLQGCSSCNITVNSLSIPGKAQLMESSVVMVPEQACMAYLSNHMNLTPALPCPSLSAAQPPAILSPTPVSVSCLLTRPTLSMHRPSHTGAARCFSRSQLCAELPRGCPPCTQQQGCLAQRVTLQVGQKQHLHLCLHAAPLCKPVGQQGDG